MSIQSKGFKIVQTGVSEKTLDTLRETLFHQGQPGERCLLDHPLVQQTAIQLKEQLISAGHLTKSAVTIQAIAFDKTPSTNWKVAWHQDLMFPFANKVSSVDFDLPCIKDGIHYARPPESVLNQLLAVRLHLDDCDETNGPLRVSVGTHLVGIIKTAEIPEQLASHGETTCLAKKGEALLLRPLTLHASSKATEPKNRRILHLVYHCGEPFSETWHRAV